MCRGEEWKGVNLLGSCMVLDMCLSGGCPHIISLSLSRGLAVLSSVCLGIVGRAVFEKWSPRAQRAVSEVSSGTVILLDKEGGGGGMGEQRWRRWRECEEAVKTGVREGENPQRALSAVPTVASRLSKAGGRWEVDGGQ
jgi:hypothetical protein